MTDFSSFESFGLPGELLDALKRKGFKVPTPIQSLVIPEVGKGKDLIVQAQTGSGKTLAFGLPLLQMEPVDQRAPSALIVSPTRELGKQIGLELKKVSEKINRSIVLATGGEGLEKQIEQLSRGAHVVVGTPGRLVELLNRNALNLKHVKVLVLDEADEILAKGFEEELNQVIQRLPKKHQTMLFSATMPSAVQRLADAILVKPQRIKVASAPETPAEIRHFFIEVTEETRFDTLLRWFETERPFMTLLFCRTRVETESLSNELGMRGIKNEYLSGELSQAKRSRILDNFRSGDLPVLVATDLAARGIDVPGITHVVNYTVPTTVETYVHRTGRTGRAGREGIALTLAAPFEGRHLHALREIVRLQSWKDASTKEYPKKKRPARR